MEKNIQENLRWSFKNLISSTLSSLKGIKKEPGAIGEISFDNLDKILYYLSESNLSNIKNLPKELAVFDILIQTDYYNPKYAYKNLQGYITEQQMVEFIEKDRKKESQDLDYFISCIPDKQRTGSFIQALHEKYDNTDLSNELAYALITNKLEINEANALKAMNEFCQSRFVAGYDPAGAENELGQPVGCEYYINGKMENPAKQFSPDLLTVEQWHNIASQDTRMMNYIPKSVLENDRFWDNFRDFVGKGRLLQNPDNDGFYNRFDQDFVFCNMPEHLKRSPEIYNELIRLKAVDNKFIKDEGLIVSKDMQMFDTSLNRDKNYMDAIDILEKYDKKLSINPSPEDVAVTRQMFSDLVDKAGYDTVAEHLFYDVETKNLNRLFGLEKQEIPEGLKVENIKVPGLNEAEIKNHLIDIAEIEKASLFCSIQDREELNLYSHIEDLNERINNLNGFITEIRQSQERNLDLIKDIERVKKYLNATDGGIDATLWILKSYDDELAKNPAKDFYTATYNMFSMIYQAREVEGLKETELISACSNLNRKFGLGDLHDVPKIINTQPLSIEIPGLDDIQRHDYIIKIASLQKDIETNPENVKELECCISEITQYRDILTNLQKLNVDIDSMKQSYTLHELLTGDKTSRLVDLSMPLGNTQVDFKAKLAVNPMDNTILIHPQRNLEEQINAGFKGHVFSEEERGNLMALGSAGKIIPIQQGDGTSEKYLVGTDSLTNELVAIRQKDVTIQDKFGGISLTEKKKEELLSGQPVFLEGIKKGGLECSSLVQYNVEKGRLEMLQYGLNISSIQNVKLQKEQQELLKEGKTVLISGLFDEKGVKYNAWVRLDMKNMKLMRSKEIPEKQVDVRKEITPSTDFRVQVSQNTKGIKTEENKFSSTPLLSGNQKPSELSEEKKSRGHKM